MDHVLSELLFTNVKCQRISQPNKIYISWLAMGLRKDKYRNHIILFVIKDTQKAVIVINLLRIDQLLNGVHLYQG